MRIPKVRYYLVDFIQVLREQLESDDLRWGDTWLRRGRVGQEERFIYWIMDKLTKYSENKEPIPWLKIAGEALINWIRETYPELGEFANLTPTPITPDILVSKHVDFDLVKTPDLAIGGPIEDGFRRDL